jgi:hypothetical protein
MLKSLCDLFALSNDLMENPVARNGMTEPEFDFWIYIPVIQR